jgi:hypothetical protein
VDSLYGLGFGWVKVAYCGKILNGIKMKIGTKSVLFGAHCFAIHPFFVMIAWIKLYGFPFHPAIWLSFFFHDLGYWGKPNMDGEEGEIHVEFGAKVLSIFDKGIKGYEYKFWQYSNKGVWWLNDYWSDEINKLRKDGWKIINIGEYYTILERPVKNTKWADFSRYHSRFYAKKDRVNPSKLCVADKLAIALEPAWLYLPRVNWSGEIKEYMALAKKREEQGEKLNKYEAMKLNSEDQKQWFQGVKDYMIRWVDAHKNDQTDHWTPKTKIQLNDNGVWI